MTQQLTTETIPSTQALLVGAVSELDTGKTGFQLTVSLLKLSAMFFQ